MAYELRVTDKAEAVIDSVAHDIRRAKKIAKCLALLEQDPHYPSLHTHRFEALDKQLGESIWESYVENRAPSAWRIWWFFGPDDGQITVVDMGPHP